MSLWGVGHGLLAQKGWCGMTVIFNAVFDMLFNEILNAIVAFILGLFNFG